MTNIYFYFRSYQAKTALFWNKNILNIFGRNILCNWKCNNTDPAPNAEHKISSTQKMPFINMKQAMRLKLTPLSLEDGLQKEEWKTNLSHDKTGFWRVSSTFQKSSLYRWCDLY